MSLKLVVSLSSRINILPTARKGISLFCLFVCIRVFCCQFQVNISLELIIPSKGSFLQPFPHDSVNQLIFFR